MKRVSLCTIFLKNKLIVAIPLFSRKWCTIKTKIIYTTGFSVSLLKKVNGNVTNTLMHFYTSSIFIYFRFGKINAAWKCLNASDGVLLPQVQWRSVNWTHPDFEW